MILLTFIISFPIHFGYNLFSNYISSIFFPVNESVWEHMKILMTSLIITGTIEYFIYKYKNIKINNFIISIPISALLSIILYLIIYSFISLFISHNFIISICLLFIIYIVSHIISYYILNMKLINRGYILGIILIILIYTGFTFLTYYPPHTIIFLDPIKENYGILKENP